MQVYLDNSATTRPCKATVEVMSRCMREEYYNPSAPYAQAVHVERAISLARQTVANAVYGNEKNTIFTSGGTESNNLAIIGSMIGQKREGVILYSAAEHPSVKNACLEAAALHGQIAKEIPLTSRGSLDLRALEEILNPRVKLLCVMQVCNETGVVMPLEKVVALRDRLAPEAAIHVDGVQGFLRVPVNMMSMRIQSYALSAHKIHGPKGVGALILADGHRVRPILVGGGQQGNVRSGTENTAGILGLSAAVEQYPHPEFSRTRMLSIKKRLLSDLSDINNLVVLGAQPEDDDSAAHILCMSLPPVRAETLVHALEAEGVMIGMGSACSSRKGKRSAVLTAMGVAPEIIDSSVRVSFSPYTTPEEIDYAAGIIGREYQKLARFRRR